MQHVVVLCSGYLPEVVGHAYGKAGCKIIGGVAARCLGRSVTCVVRVRRGGRDRGRKGILVLRREFKGRFVSYRILCRDSIAELIVASVRFDPRIRLCMPHSRSCRKTATRTTRILPANFRILI